MLFLKILFLKTRFKIIHFWDLIYKIYFKDKDGSSEGNECASEGENVIVCSFFTTFSLSYLYTTFTWSFNYWWWCCLFVIMHPMNVLTLSVLVQCSPFKVSHAVSNQIKQPKQIQGITCCFKIKSNRNVQTKSRYHVLLYNESLEEAKEASGNLLSPNIVIDINTAIVIIASQWSVESSISHYVIGVTV